MLRIGPSWMRTIAAVHVLVEQPLAAREEAFAPHVLEPVGLDHLDRAEVLLDPRRQRAELGLDVALSRGRCACDSAWPTRKISGYGRIASSATFQSIHEHVRRARSRTRSSAFARWTRPAPHIARTVWTSFVSRDITSPVGVIAEVARATASAGGRTGRCAGRTRRARAALKIQTREPMRVDRGRDREHDQQQRLGEAPRPAGGR